ncbi:NAD-dependent epimerase/dehydratase family protein [Flagellimonas meridianipacifica]|uniref:Nucleoside-diphosphate-sugar epimerase n=1 Tax=Flagellimonas meridianipacifica TaxID=1080225 RepID=A0A2T0MG40_9FLAO|nr:NAD-dependent epimerase/dehydratase family protein [Allomuricauda pacifica]PRX56532.1 nucleoside-diphosphate-sugar epimerase [Allomuricauda pacifica]
MILVTGGTGLLGSHLLYQLVQDGGTVRATYRDPKKKTKVLEVFGFYSEEPHELYHKIQWVEANVTDLASLEPCFEGVNQVYHCAALISFDPKDLNDLLKTNVDGTANMINLSVKYKVNKFCHVSSIAALGSGKKGQTIYDENVEWNDNQVSVYGISKFESELEVWRGSQEGLPVVIVNPGIVLGPGFWRSGSGLLFRRASKGGRYSFPSGSGFVSVNDVVNSMVLLMQSNIENERYILVNQNLTYHEVFLNMAKALGVEPPSKIVSLSLLEILWRIDFLKSTFFGKRRRLTKNLVKGLYQQDKYDNSKSKTIPNFTYESLNEVIGFCCEKFKVTMKA